MGGEEDEDKEEEEEEEAEKEVVVVARGRPPTREAKVERLGVLRELAKNGMEYVVLEVSGRDGKAATAGGGTDVSEEEVVEFFLGFRIDKVNVVVPSPPRAYL